MLVQSILQSKARGAGIVTVPAHTLIADAAQILAENRIGALIVATPNGVIDGILSERDIVRGLAQQGEACLKAPVSELMTAAVLTCREDDTIENLMQVMTSRRIRHLPVLDGRDQLIGIVTIGDVVKSRLDEATQEVNSLRDYVAAV